MRTSYVTRRVIVYFGLKRESKDYWRAAARVARYRRMRRLGRAEYLRQERERAAELRRRAQARIGLIPFLARERQQRKARPCILPAK